INGSVGQTGGPDNLVKVGGGTLILAGSGSFTGFTRIKAGTLQLENSAALQQSTLEMNPAYTGSIVFGTPTAFTLGGLTGSANLDMQGKTLSIGNNNTDTTYSGVLSNGSLTKVGTGTLTLTVDSSYTGPTVVNAGRLTLARTAGDRAQSTIQSTSITVNAGAELRLASSCQFGWDSYSRGTTFTLNGGTLSTADNTHNYIPYLVLQNGGTLSMGTGGWANTWQVFDLRSITSQASATTNLITSTGGYMANRGAVTIDVADGAADPDLRISATFSNGTAGTTSITKLGAGTLELTAANVYTGTTTIGSTTASGGVLRITHGQALGTTDAGTTVLSGQLQLAGNITVSGESLTLNHSGGTAGATLLRSVSGNNTWAGPISVALHSRVEVDSGSTLTISGNISGVRLDKGGAGTLVLSGDNSGVISGWYMDVYNGVVLLRSNNSPYGAYFHIQSPGAVHFENNITTPGGKILYLSNQASEANPQVRSLSGNNTWGGNVVLHVSTDDASRSKYIGVDLGSTLTILGTISESSAGVTGPRHLVKVGGGVLELKGAGTYTGETRIMAGTLLANNTTGSATGSGLVRAIGGMLGGNGTIGGSVQVESGGSISAGTSPGKLTIQGNLTVQTGGTMLVEIGGYTQGGIGAGGYDWLSVGGSAVLQPNSILRVALWGGFEPKHGDIFHVLTASGGITDLGLQLVPEGLRPAQYWTYGIQPWQGQGGGQVLFLTFQVPEPATAVLLALGLGGLYLLGRRWKKLP
ncbi:MAG: autotransporter-associated beta strand repeat-containing protein, partial [Thermoguttaceae bacterium]|nr:autotransporter-associated beta strand repeat-containing protein [Thermoguttaceae bacterium]MDW8036522.1 autotransporter-associated beta strand repeat-containing protein [Thermoguttaceae bacterium]